MIIVRSLFWVLKHLSTAMAAVAGTGVLILAFMIVIDIGARRLAGFSLQGTDEVGGYVLAVVAALGFSYVLFERGFTRIDLFVRRLPPLANNILNVVAYLSLAAIALFFAQRSLATLGDTLRFDAHANTPLQTPLWIPQGLWAVGMGFFALCSVLYALRALVLLFVDQTTLEEEYGIARVEEEVSEIAEIAETSLEADIAAIEEKRP